MYFSKKEEAKIIAAIRAAEHRTTGEIRVYIEDFCELDDPVERAVELFVAKGMDKTRARTGVLLYIARQSRQFAIWGDSGIDQAAGPRFWEKERNLLRSYLQADQACDGICAVIHEIGTVLHQQFPADTDDNPNELPDDIIYG